MRGPRPASIEKSCDHASIFSTTHSPIIPALTMNIAQQPLGATPHVAKQEAFTFILEPSSVTLSERKL